MHQAVCGSINLLLRGATLLLSVCEGDIDQTGVCGFVRCSKYE